MIVLILGILLVPVVIYGVLALAERSKTNTLTSYLQFGEPLSRFNFFATLTASSAGLASTLLLVSVYGYLYGLGVFVWVLLFWWLTQWASTRTIKLVEAQHPGFWANRGTFHEYLGLSFGSQNVRVTAAILSILCYTLLLVAEVFLSYRIVYAALEGGTQANTSFPFSPLSMIVHGCILLLVFGYTAIAGFRAVIKTDAVQFGIMCFMMLAVLIFLGPKLPEIIGLHKSVFGSTLAESMLNPVSRDTFSFLVFFVLMNLAFWVAWWPVAMDQWHRCAASMSTEIATDKQFGTSGLWARTFVLVLVATFVLIGASVRTYVAPAADISDPLPVFVQSIMPGGKMALTSSVLAIGLTTLVIMGLMAAVLSTIDTYLMVVVQSLVLDVGVARQSGKSLVEADADPGTRAWALPRVKALSFLWLAVILGVAYLVSRVTADAFNVVYAAFAFQMAFVCVVLVSLFGRPQGTAKSAVFSLIIGGLWCAATFPVLIHWLNDAVTAGNSDLIYSLLDQLFANTVLVGVVAGAAYFISRLVLGRSDETQ
jgi:Na+/proline symporter